MAAHKIGGRFYTFTATPNGDQLTVRPYTGELGTFRIGPGTRQLEGLAMSGSLEARDRTAAVGELTTDQVSMAATATCELPVGDYLPTYLRIEFGRLRITVSQNYHSDGHPRERAGRAAVHGIPIRADKPFVLDFSNQPEVMFAAPATNQTLKRGDTLLVKAVLVDAPLDLMIRGLDDATRKQTKDADGNALGYQRDLSLDPTVTVTRASGEKVAEGVMPFG